MKRITLLTGLLAGAMTLQAAPPRAAADDGQLAKRRRRGHKRQSPVHIPRRLPSVPNRQRSENGASHPARLPLFRPFVDGRQPGSGKNHRTDQTEQEHGWRRYRRVGERIGQRPHVRAFLPRPVHGPHPFESRNDRRHHPFQLPRHGMGNARMPRLGHRRARRRAWSSGSPRRAKVITR